MYKPVTGERALWDFPDGTLAGREVAAYLVSAAGSWGVVPPTVLREGPFGPGSVQLWIDTAEPQVELVDLVPPNAVGQGWLAVVRAEGMDGSPVVLVHADRPELASVAAFDAVTNNADRKGSHLVIDQGGRVRGFDHGVSLHVENKLRTILWGWAGRAVPEADLARLDRLGAALDEPDGELRAALLELLTPAEVAALRLRTTMLRRRGSFPVPTGQWRSIPWPPL